MQRLGTLLFLSAMLALPLLLGSILPGWSANAWASDGAAGRAQEIFQARRCDECHGIQDLGIALRSAAEAAGPDLSQVGAARDAASIAGHLQGSEAPVGERHPAWQGPDEELEELSNWLATLE